MSRYLDIYTDITYLMTIRRHYIESRDGGRFPKLEISGDVCSVRCECWNVRAYPSVDVTNLF